MIATKRRHALNDRVTQGVSDAFDQTKADLRGMIPQKPSWVNQVLHEATIEVNEVGAEASAVAAALADPFGPAEDKPKSRTAIFVANRPFLWLVQHKTTELILFMGRFAGG
jgi:serine protease inhibitor